MRGKRQFAHTHTYTYTCVTTLCNSLTFYSALATVTVQTKQCNVQEEIAESLQITCSAPFSSSMWKYMSWVRQTKLYCYCSLSVDMEADLEFLLCFIVLVHPSNSLTTIFSRKVQRTSESKGSILFLRLSWLLWILDFQNHFIVLFFWSSFILAYVLLTWHPLMKWLDQLWIKYFCMLSLIYSFYKQ